MKFGKYTYVGKTEDGKYKFEEEESDETIELEETFIGDASAAYLEGVHVINALLIPSEDETEVVVRSLDDKPVTFRSAVIYFTLLSSKVCQIRLNVLLQM